MTDSTEIAQYELPPGAVVAEHSLETGQAACQMLMGFIKGSKLKPVKIGKSEHIRIEHWAFLGKYFGITAEVVDVQPYGTERERGFIAKAILLNADQRKIGGAFAMCTDDEANWKTRDTHAIFSMAQTRACSKAFATCLRWIPVLAGMSGTPLEEMPYNREPQSYAPPGRSGTPPPRSNGSPPVRSAPKGATHQDVNDRLDESYATTQMDESEVPFDPNEPPFEDTRSAKNDGVSDWPSGHQPDEGDAKFKPGKAANEPASEKAIKTIKAGLMGLYDDWDKVNDYVKSKTGHERMEDMTKIQGWEMIVGLKAHKHLRR